MTSDKALLALESIQREQLSVYHAYFDSIRPDTDEERFRRGLFAHASVHTTWQKNVDMYALLWDLKWRSSFKDLRERIYESRAGLTNNRSKYIWEFNQKFWADPRFYDKRSDEGWAEYRDRIQERTLGLGHAKTSFFIELMHFQDARVVCGDTHQLQLYGFFGREQPSRKMMDQIEAHWVAECSRLDLPPVTARWFLWDRKQRRTDSRYWAYVLEGSKPDTRRPLQMDLFYWPAADKAA